MQGGSGTRDGEVGAGLDRTRMFADDEASIGAHPTLIGPDDLGHTLADTDAEAEQEDALGLVRGDPIGRFVMLELLGVGGMGEVYLCYDPELDRRVAVKLLRPLRGARIDAARARLLREARAIARLSHPNVVTVHDVAVWEGRVFLAMEHVDGPTLALWVREHHGDWAAIVEMYRCAGEGLAAAHRAGLVHRDFKPDNVLVDAGGRPRVLDFGIARAAEGEEAPHGSRIDPVGDPSLTLTTTGMLLGTPAYMAPEQLASLPVDARTDQFSFCVALWEALYGVRPFAGESLASLAARVLAGDIRPPPREARVPERIEQALRRGLSVDPARRFPDMHGLLAALAPTRAGPRRWGVTAAALALAGGVVGWAASASTGDLAAACTGDAMLLAGAWDDARQAAGAAAFTRTGAPAAAATWDQAARIVDEWQTRWLAARARACADTHRHHRQSTEALDLRLACLSRQVNELAARSELWADADAEVVARAVESASALPRPETCDHAATHDRELAPPTGLVDRVEAVRAALARVRALTAAGKYTAAASLARTQQDLADELQHAPTRAEAALVLARALDMAGEPQPARARYHAATRIALEAGADELALSAAIGLAAVTGVVLSHYDEGEGWLEVAAGLATRVPEGDEHIRLERVSCSFANDRGLLAQARPHCERGLQLAEALHGPDSLEAARSLLNLGNNHVLARRHVEARALLARAWQIERGVLGEHHPHLMTLANSRAAAEYYAGDLDAATARWHEGLAIAEASVGRDHLDTGLIHINLAVTALEMRAWDQAEREVAEIERIYLRVKGAESSELVVVHFVRGRLARVRGDLARAREHAELQLRYARETRSAEHPDVLRAHLELGEVLTRQGQPAAAGAEYTAAQALAEQLGDPDATAQALRGLCRALVQQGRPAEAIAVCERGLEGSATLERAEVLRAELQGWLAQAVIAAGQDPTRGETLAAAARSALLALTDPNTDQPGPRAADAAEALADLDAWSSRRPPDPVP